MSAGSLHPHALVPGFAAAFFLVFIYFFKPWLWHPHTPPSVSVITVECRLLWCRLVALTGFGMGACRESARTSRRVVNRQCVKQCHRYLFVIIPFSLSLPEIKGSPWPLKQRSSSEQVVVEVTGWSFSWIKAFLHVPQCPKITETEEMNTLRWSQFYCFMIVAVIKFHCYHHPVRSVWEWCWVIQNLLYTMSPELTDEREQKTLLSTGTYIGHILT